MTATPQRPNVLLITTDQQRFDALGIANPDGPLRTTALDALASEGVWYRNAYTTCPVCIPARRSLLSGLHPRSHGLVRYQDGLDWEAPISLPGLLAAAGWQTELVGKLHLHPQRKRYGYQHMVRVESSNDRWDTPLQPVNAWADWMRSQGYEHPNDLGINGNGRCARPWDKPEHTHLTSWLADRAVDFLVEHRDPTSPFFLHLSFIDPHPPLIPPQAYWDRYFRRHDVRPAIGSWAPAAPARRGVPDVSARGPFLLDEIQDAMAGYWGAVHHLDDRIRYVLTRLCEYGSPRAKEPTLIIFTTDHGELLGDHHLWRKSLGYEGAAHIPFIVAGRNLPGLQPGVCDDLVCLEDIVPTVLERCGLPVPPPLGAGIDGRSFAARLGGGGAPLREALCGECDHNHYVVAGGWKYLWFRATGEEQLFHLAEDPRELTDLSGRSPRLAEMRALLARHLAPWPKEGYGPAACRPCDGAPPRALFGR